VTTEPGRALVVSTIAGEHETPARMGSASYSYYYVYRAFAPLLQRWGAVVETVRPAQHLDDLLQRVRQQQSAVIHLGFLPLDAFHRTSQAPNVAFPFWDFPDLPASPLGGNPHNDWTAIANSLDRILTCSEFTRDAFAGSGVRTPISVVPVPVRPAYFDLPLWTDQRVVIDCKCYVVTPAPPAPPRLSGAKRMYRLYVAPRLSRRSADALGAAAHALSAVRSEWRDMGAVDCVVNDSLELSGIVYTTVLNPFDQRKNWPDLLTAYLLALDGCDDATLVIKLAVPPDLASAGVNKILRFYRRLALAHRCRLVLVSDYLTDAQLLELARGSTYYLNSSRAEGACLPMQDFLAAARPAIAPRHTAIADYFADGSGFVVESHPEPASWPQDPEGHCRTTWHRLVWPSLRDAIGESYQVAKSRRAHYETLAANARAAMTARAGSDVVWTRLAAALNSVGHAL
jgi:glycosyltransferase involved in cell wall biosynthesis